MSDSNIIKIALIGQSGAGKTSLINKIVKDSFGPGSSTVGVGKAEKDIEYDNLSIHLIIYDTAGQEEYGPTADFYLRGVDLILICFDPKLDDAENKLKFWKEHADNRSTSKSQILVSTKSDLWSKEIPPPALVSNPESLHKKYQTRAYFQTSSLNGSGITELLQGLCQIFFENKRATSDDDDAPVDINKPIPKDKCSC